MNIHSDTLDSEELLHLAVAASNRNDSMQAIELLRRAIAVTPGYAHAHYLLGAEHAQLGMYDRAIEDMREALRHDPDLATARFQLGLLLLTSRQPDSAAQIWGPLDTLGPQHCLVLFRDGLLHLAHDDFATAAAKLNAGIAANTENMPLNADSKKVLRANEAASQGPGPSAPAPKVDESNADSSNHLLVGAYASMRRP